MWIIDATSNTINRTAQGIKREDVKRAKSTLAMHACFARNTRKVPKKTFCFEC